jgi:hypothetical protein
MAIWSAIRSWNYASEGSPPVGAEAVGVMLNASMCRLDNPGVFPHRTSSAQPTLADVFPLPMILCNGRYYLDDRTQADESLRYMQKMPPLSSSDAVSKDCMQLVPLSPLADGRPGCGFYDEQIEAATSVYGRFGLGCPQAGLTDAQSAFRAERGIGDSCRSKYIRTKSEATVPGIGELGQPAA